MPSLDEPALEGALREALEAVARQPGVRYADARYVDETSERLLVRDLRPELVATSRSSGVGVRVLGEKTWGFACTDDVRPAAVAEAAKRALAIARASSRVTRRSTPFPPQSASVGSYATPLREDPFSVPIDDKLALLDAAVRGLLARGKPVQSAEARMEWTRQHKRLVSTEGTDVRQTFTYGACGMVVHALGDSGRTQRRSYPTCAGSDGFQGGYECVRALDLVGQAPRIADEAVALLSAPACPSGMRDVILESSQVALQVHESCGHPTELDRALGGEISLAGGSFLQPAMLGKLRYGAPIVDLVADATSPGGMGTFGWDDEGVPGAKHPLVREGIFVDYLSSRETAAALGRASTGTMRAESWNRLPLIRMVNVSLEPKSGTLDDLIADTADGLYVECDKSWSIDDLRLGFQFSCELAWEIKHGKRARMLRDPYYAGVTPEFWRSCDAVCGPSEFRLWGLTNCGKGDPMQIMQVGHGASPARFHRVTVGNSGGEA